LQHKNNPICTIRIQASEIYIKNKIERPAQVDLGSIPYTPALGIHSRGKCVAITGILGGRSIQDIGIQLANGIKAGK
jgi:hypothetical protein